jgi:aldehyde dehydrogenase (NAD+)
MGAWNYPISLCLQPLCAAIAAGCCAIVKPSELASASQTLLAKLIPKYLDQSAIRVVTGGPAEMANILEHKYNVIFFTGSSKIARFITAAAAKHLTPTVLELGGQGPAIVTSKAQVDLAAKRIAAAKFMNGGQICLSVNHVFVDPKIYDEFVSRAIYWADTFARTGQMVTIINERNFDRLAGLLQKTQGKIVAGGTMDRAKLVISPTVVTGVTLDGKLLFYLPIYHLIAVTNRSHRFFAVRRTVWPYLTYHQSRSRRGR